MKIIKNISEKEEKNKYRIYNKKIKLIALIIIK